MAGNEETSDDGRLSELPPDFGDGSIEIENLSQVLEMDDDDDRDFSKGIVVGFFEQASKTFSQMDESIASRNLLDLSRLGHFLKGSSATLGLKYVKESCEKIQHWGSKKDDDGQTPLEDEDVCLARIKKRLVQLREEYAVVEKHLKRFYGL